MTRLEDNAELIKEVTGWAIHLSGTHEEMTRLQLRIISAMLMDISRSLAVLADKAEREGEK